MEILFKDDKFIYYLDKYIQVNFIVDMPSIDLSNIPHLDDVEPLYHYIDNDSKFRYPVYYEYSGDFITKYSTKYSDEEYGLIDVRDSDIKDYTLVNIKLLDSI